MKGPGPARIAGAGFALLTAATAAPATPAAHRQDPPRIQAGRIPSDLRIDGVLDEPVWSQAAGIDNLTMIDPTEGAPPSARTTVRVLADEGALAIGVRCFDPHPAAMVSFSVARDARMRDEDHISIVFGTFLDGRSGYVFRVNPGGARYDALITNRGEDENSEWDGIWEARTSRDAQGWSLEMRIPILTLTFKRGLRSWHLNIERRIQRLQEWDRWADPSRNHRVTQTSQAGLLTGLPSFELGVGLTIRPSAIASIEAAAPGESAELDGDASLDLSQRLGSNLLGSLTINTDFAETEVDERRTNLTRFPLFFPEKRTFFLEGADIFEFGLGLHRSIVPFHSRRIGLVEGEEVPLRIGAKLNGQIGGTSIGALAVHMDSKNHIAPETSMGVVRLRQNIFAESSIGMITTLGDPSGRDNSWMSGADFTYQSSEFLDDKNFLVGLWGLATGREDLESGGREAFGGKIDFPNDLWDISLSAMQIGENFDPSLGFVPRRGVQKYRAGLSYEPRPEWSWLRKMNYEFFASVTTDLHGEWESYRIFTAPLNWDLESGDQVEFNIVPTGERLDEDFEISDGVVIPAGTYEWTRFRLSAETASKRALSAGIDWWFGHFYTGSHHNIEFSADWNPTPLLTLELAADLNYVRLPEGDFNEHLYSTRAQVNFSPDLVLSSFIQYDTESQSLGTNTRLRWTISPLSELFVVWNYNWNRMDGNFQRDSYAALVKFYYTFRF